MRRVMVHARLRDGSLRAAATENGATMLLYEGGEAWRFDTAALDVGVRGIRRVLGELGMIDRDADDGRRRSVPMESRRTSWVRARRSGLALLQTGLGAEVTPGQLLGVIHDSVGKRLSRITATTSGVVIGHIQHPLVNQGDAVANIAEITQDAGDASRRDRRARAGDDRADARRSDDRDRMKLAILSRAPRSYSTQRLKLAAIDRGHQCKVLDTLRFAIDLSGPEPDLQFRGKPLSDYDAIVPRIGASITYFGSAVVRQFEQMDVYTPNTANGIANSRDKLRAIQILSRHDIGMPRTAFVRNRQDVLSAIDRVGGAPVVIKLLEGTQGIGVILAPDNKVAEAIIETMQSTRQNVLIQQFVAESKGRDIRALVVGDRVVAAMRRTAQGDEFRSNVHRGGSVEGVTLDAAYERTAVRSAQIMGLRVAGVDMLEGKRRAAGDGGQLVARARRHRTGHRSRHRRRDRRPRRQPGRLPRTRRAPATLGQHRLRRRRDCSCVTAATSSDGRSPRPACATATSRCSRCTATPR